MAVDLRSLSEEELLALLGQLPDELKRRTCSVHPQKPSG